MIFQENYQKFMEITHLMINNQDQEAKKKVEKLILQKVDTQTSNEALLSHIVATSLLKRIDRQLLESKNIYLQQFDIPQIVLFYKMAEAFPLVVSSHDVANQYLESKLKNLTEATLFDIGIGKGKQLEALLKKVAQKAYPLQKVNVIGLDPDLQNVNDSQETMEKLNQETSFEIKYFPYCTMVENFTENDYREIKKISGDSLLINSALTMHHISHPIGDTERRTQILMKIKELKPLLLTLIEPNSDHDVDKISKRLHNCWLHFGSVYEMIDQSSIGQDHKFLIKEKFFGREIRDLFSVSDYLRSERHETHESWLFRLTRAGYKPYPYQEIQISLPDYCEYQISEGYVRYGYHSLPILGVFAYHLD